LVLSWVMFHLLSFIAGHPLWMTKRCDRSGISPRGKGSKPGPAQPPRRADRPIPGKCHRPGGLALGTRAGFWRTALPRSPRPLNASWVLHLGGPARRTAMCGN
jgi:hypothetical protein